MEKKNISATPAGPAGLPPGQTHFQQLQKVPSYPSSQGLPPMGHPTNQASHCNPPLRPPGAQIAQGAQRYPPMEKAAAQKAQHAQPYPPPALQQGGGRPPVGHPTSNVSVSAPLARPPPNARPVQAYQPGRKQQSNDAAPAAGSSARPVQAHRSGRNQMYPLQQQSIYATPVTGSIPPPVQSYQPVRNQMYPRPQRSNNIAPATDLSAALVQAYQLVGNQMYPATGSAIPQSAGYNSATAAASFVPSSQRASGASHSNQPLLQATSAPSAGQGGSNAGNQQNHGSLQQNQKSNQQNQGANQNTQQYQSANPNSQKDLSQSRNQQTNDWDTTSFAASLGNLSLQDSSNLSGGDLQVTAQIGITNDNYDYQGGYDEQAYYEDGIYDNSGYTGADSTSYDQFAIDYSYDQNGAINDATGVAVGYTDYSYDQYTEAFNAAGGATDYVGFEASVQTFDETGYDDTGAAYDQGAQFSGYDTYGDAAYIGYNYSGGQSTEYDESVTVFDQSGGVDNSGFDENVAVFDQSGDVVDSGYDDTNAWDCSWSYDEQ